MCYYIKGKSLDAGYTMIVLSGYFLTLGEEYPFCLCYLEIWVTKEFIVVYLVQAIKLTIPFLPSFHEDDKHNLYIH